MLIIKPLSSKGLSNFKKWSASRTKPSFQDRVRNAKIRTIAYAQNMIIRSKGMNPESIVAYEEVWDDNNNTLTYIIKEEYESNAKEILEGIKVALLNSKYLNMKEEDFTFEVTNEHH